MVDTTPQPLYPRKRPCTCCIRGWVDPETIVDGAENLPFTVVWTLKHSACRESIYWPHYLCNFILFLNRHLDVTQHLSSSPHFLLLLLLLWCDSSHLALVSSVVHLQISLSPASFICPLIFSSNEESLTILSFHLSRGLPTDLHP